MKWHLVLAAALVTGNCLGQTARDYYNELYAAGGLDRFAARYVCFNENPEVKVFLIFMENKDLREDMVANGTFNKLSKAQQAEVKKDWLIFRNYDKGVAVGPKEFLDADGSSSWVSEKFMIQKVPARLRFRITWETMRYKRSVELLNADGTKKVKSRATVVANPCLLTCIRPGIN